MAMEAKLSVQIQRADEKMKKRAMRTVCSFSGVRSISIDLSANDQILTFMADNIPGNVDTKLGFCHAKIQVIRPYVEPVREPNLVSKTKVELKVINKEKMRKKAMKVACGISGIKSISMDRDVNKLTLKGDISPLQAVDKLKFCVIDIACVRVRREQYDEANNSTRENVIHRPMQRLTVEDVFEGAKWLWNKYF